ncbi:hypothetical protein [Pedobacter heparinus]|uniref:hypothetical protein n=1 Tax=Pedobacter heparinus TaxID=984 RepID=UPI0029315523|nr:hypothetical protein [Pedobacter heparinus]
MNKHILDNTVQDYISHHLNDDVHKIAMAKSPFPDIEARELAGQIAAKKKSAKKLPSWYHQDGIYYPPALSIEQCSSESTAAYKAKLLKGKHVIDLTGGFGVDAHYFAKAAETVCHCEINPELSAIAAYNAGIFKQHNTQFIATDGIRYLQDSTAKFDTIYIDPARRSTAGKVFMLKDCTPDITVHLDLLLAKSQKIIIKTAPLLDLSAGLKELKNVSEIYILSVKNEVKELLWVLKSTATKTIQVTAVSLNETQKAFGFFKGAEEVTAAKLLESTPHGYLYEPDAALLKSGGFNLIGLNYGLKKLNIQTQLYTSDQINSLFPGRIFKIHRVINPGELKKEKMLRGNVIVRNYRDRAENLVQKYKIKPDKHQFLIFTQSRNDGYIVVDATIIQHY